ncbi:MAG: hypothetical protein LIO54_00095 [Oscillospiraceae bacterium]|nr:hypothetical protein [Oscillospiraceae bacterium]
MSALKRWDNVLIGTLSMAGRVETLHCHRWLSLHKTGYDSTPPRFSMTKARTSEIFHAARFCRMLRRCLVFVARGFTAKKAISAISASSPADETCRFVSGGFFLILSVFLRGIGKFLTESQLTRREERAIIPQNQSDK